MSAKHSLPSTDADLARAYMAAKEAVIRSGFAAEIDWQEDLSLHRISESDFLREMAWVVLSAGMSEAVVAKIFPRFSNAFLNWRSAQAIQAKARMCSRAALRVFGSRRKVKAILEVVELVADCGFPAVKQRLLVEGVKFVQELPFMGPATSFHLAKNLGLDVVKPDRHLLRVAEITGCQTPLDLCERIAHFVGEKLSVVDVVVWRYATLDRNYLAHFDPSKPRPLNKRSHFQAMKALNLR